MAALALAHPREDSAKRVQEGSDVGVDGQVDVPAFSIDKARHTASEAGIVDQYVDFEGCERAIQRVGIAQIEYQGGRARFVGQRFEPVGTSRYSDNGEAGTAQRVHGRPADSRGRTGNQGRPVVMYRHQVSPSPLPDCGRIITASADQTVRCCCCRGPREPVDRRVSDTRRGVLLYFSTCLCVARFPAALPARLRSGTGCKYLRLPEPADKPPRALQ